MPTTRRRHQITETDRIAQALDDAERAWPELGGNRAKLLVRLVESGHAALAGEHQQSSALLRDAVRRASGSMTGVYSADYLEELRSEWPE